MGSLFKLIESILGFEGGGLDLLLLVFLKKALRALDAKFGLFLLFDREEKLLSMAKAGEFSKKEEIEKRAKGRSGILPMVVKTIKPYIANDLEIDPFHVSFREEEVNSELEYPFFLKDGRKGVVILLSKKKNHFKKEHLKEMKRIEKEFCSLVEKLEGDSIATGVILFECNIFGRAMEELLGKEWKVIHLRKFEEIFSYSKNIKIEFIFRECDFKCSKECKEIFLLSQEEFLPVVILRPFSFDHSNFNSFLCSLYTPFSLSSSQKKIIELLKDSKYYTSSDKWQCNDRVSMNIGFVQRSIVESNGTDASNLSKQFNLTLSHLSRSFHLKVGVSLREYINKIRMCNSLFNLIDGKSIRNVSSKAGYRDRFSFSKAFKRNFGFSPSKIIEK